MRRALTSRLLLGFIVWQWLAGSYSFGQASDTYSSVRTLSNAIPIELPLSIYILYFDQSSPKLRPGVEVTLDSIARQLARQPEWLATVTGYTDDIGKRELNMVLAKQRAKLVAGYLKKRGVHADQIMTNWEGPDRQASVEAPTAVKTISRRVIIQLAPKK